MVIRIGVPLLLIMIGFAAPADDIDPGVLAQRSAETAMVSGWSADIEILELDAQGRVQRERAGTLSSRLTENGIDSERKYRFRSPQDVRGTILLIHEHAAKQDDIWLYLPALGKTRRIAGSSKKSSFLGTQYAYADLMTFQHEKYQHRLVDADRCELELCWIVDSYPKDPEYAEQIGYSKIRSWISEQGFLTVRTEYYDLGGALLKTQVMADFASSETSKERALPRATRMENHRSGRVSVIRLSPIDFDPPFGGEEFSPARLSR
jgi:hypothetical protein